MSILSRTAALVLFALVWLVDAHDQAALAQSDCRAQPNRICLYAEALDDAAAYEDRSIRTWTLAGWIDALVAAPRPDDAAAIPHVERAVGLMEEGEQHDAAVMALAMLQARAGRVDSALATLERLAASAAPVRARLVLAIALDRAGRAGDAARQIELARAALLRSFDRSKPDDLVATLGPLLTEASGTATAVRIFDLALQFVLTATNPKDRVYAVTVLGRLAGEAGLAAPARRTLDDVRTQIEHLAPDERAGARFFLADAEVKLGWIDAALEDVARIGSPASLVLALITVGEAQAARGDAAGARKTLGEAAKAAEARVEIFDRLNAFLPLVRALHGAGLADEAHLALGRAQATLSRATDPVQRLNLVSMLVDNWVQLKDLRAAGDLLRAARDEVSAANYTGDRAAALWRIAFNFGRAGLFDDAITTIGQLSGDETRLRARFLLAAAYAGADRIAEAAALIEHGLGRIPAGSVSDNVAAWLDASIALARAYARAGHTAEAAATLAPGLVASRQAETGKRASWLRDAVEIYGSIGRLDEAWAASQMIDDLPLRYDTLSELAAALMRGNRLREAYALGQRVRASDLPADLRLAFSTTLSTMMP